jgi:hypothetical protein
MMEFPRKLVSSVEYEPVAYDVSIVQRGSEFLVVIREDDRRMTIPKPTLQEAQEVMELLKPDVFTAPDVPWSVFCPIRKVSHVVA